MTDDVSADDCDYFDDDVPCGHCDGTGWHISCPDDMCRGTYQGGPWPPCGDDRCVYPCSACNPDGADGF